MKAPARPRSEAKITTADRRTTSRSRVSGCSTFERELLDYLRRNTTILDTLRDTNVLDDDTVAELTKRTDEFILEFQAGKGQAIGKPGHEEVAAAQAEDVNQEKIVKGRR